MDSATEPVLREVAALRFAQNDGKGNISTAPMSQAPVMQAIHFAAFLFVEYRNLTPHALIDATPSKRR
jgi:hypothetical protein